LYLTGRYSNKTPSFNKHTSPVESDDSGVVIKVTEESCGLRSEKSTPQKQHHGEQPKNDKLNTDTFSPILGFNAI